MQDQLDEARRLVLLRIIGWAGSERSIDPSAPGHLRNLAAVYDVLTNKKLQERRIAPITMSDGKTNYYDAFGAWIDPEVAVRILRGEET